MPDNPNKEFASWSILQTIQLQAVATWMLQDLLGKLDTLQKQIADRIFSLAPSSALMPSEQKRRLEILLGEVQRLILATYAEILSRTGDYFDELADVEDERTKKAFGLIFDVTPGATDLTKIAAVTILGATLADWINGQAEDLYSKFTREMVQGISSGDEVQWLVWRIIGHIGTQGKTEAEKLIHSAPGIFKGARRDLETVIRTGVEAVADEVGKQTAETAPASFALGWQQISVLDSRTTQICRAYAFKLWDRQFKPLGHSLPYDGGVPRHWGCRSRIVPVTLDEAEVKGLTFSDWLNSLDRKAQDQIFGEKTMELYRKGKMSEQQLIRQQERTLTTEQLRTIRDPRLPND